MDDLIKVIAQCNWQTVIAMFLIGWYFTRDIRVSLMKLDYDIKEQGRRTDKLYEMFIDLLKEGRK